ncbi:hypothetical protein D7B24_001274 [Verticillium nonalfalfae]|uniref:DUF1365 domain-containing protein n=1 Tax=Verticillium nonalfalfae TaxID=1051616 RepID=A0A3M9Y1V6_9PEZI|nr:uncharacterized protein D7B24_001274 [Verticillium nonalfalfae]RNJ53866.1 hypothetical protein D7B24_001274 [Verticillium nonalfalfae]
MLAGIAYEALLGGWLDVALILVFTAWREAALIRYAIIAVGSSLLNNHVTWLVVFWPYIKQLAIISFAFLVLGSWLHGTPAKQTTWAGLGKPLLIPAKTTHRRTFPAKHGFSYSYLVVGVPVGWTGSAGGMVSSGTELDSSGGGNAISWLRAKTHGTCAWFHVNEADHLGREPGTLETKLHNYLKSQDVDPNAYPHAYLVTAASFLGYNFNPVSFWYLYTTDKTLAAMILEVNNTFGERRMYFLAMDERVADEPDTNTSRLSKSWPKDFHVSPFNSRKGSYSLQIHDMLSSNSNKPGRLDGTITLKSSKDHPKIVARLFQEGDPVDPTTASLATKLMFLLSWWWVGFVTFPRIVKEAGRLFFRRKLHVWFRPEPLKDSMGRVADTTERQLEPIFRDYLHHLVQQSGANLTVKYTSSSGDAPLIIKGTSSSGPVSQHTEPRAADSDDQIEFRVLTPVFYTRFVHYAHDFEAVFSELRESETIWVSRPELLPRLFVSKKAAAPLRISSPLDFVYFKAIRALRERPERIERPLTSSVVAAPSEKAGTQRTDDLRQFRISGMDGFVLAHEDKHVRKLYRSLVLRVFLAERLALGSMELLWLQELILRVGTAWAVSENTSGYLAGRIMA